MFLSRLLSSVTLGDILPITISLKSQYFHGKIDFSSLLLIVETVPLVNTRAFFYTGSCIVSCVG